MYLCYIIYGKHHSLLACWDSHSFRSVSKSTCTPLAANFLCCRSKLLSNFFCRRSRSLRRNSSAGIGSPEQVTGCALWAGRPGPFLVCSFFLHFARRFWNHTCKIKLVIYCKFIILAYNTAYLYLTYYLFWQNKLTPGTLSTPVVGFREFPPTWSRDTISYCMYFPDV